MLILNTNPFLLSVSVNGEMSDDITSADMAEEATAPFLSNLDFFILSLIAGMAVYWLFFKNKQKEQPVFKKLTVA